MREFARACVFAALLALATGCGIGTTDRDAFDRRFPFARSTAASARGLADLRERIRATLGEHARIARLRLAGEDARFLAQVPKRRSEFDEYLWNDFSLGKPKPEKLDDDDRKKMPERLFELDEVPFDAIPAMVREAHARLGFEGGVLALVEVERRPKTKGLRITVHERGVRRDGHVEFDADGNVVAASPE
jgi:hypothetical protein